MTEKGDGLLFGPPVGGVAASLPGLSPPRRPKRPLEVNANPRLSFPIKYAAVCNAVAAAALLAAWLLALVSFVAQSGRILSVVITVGAFAEIDAVLRRDIVTGARPGLATEFKEEEEDIAEETFPRLLVVIFTYTNPLRNGGGSYVTPNSGCWQYGQLAGSETKRSGLDGNGDVPGLVASLCSCSGGCGSGLFICTKHSEHRG